MDRVGDDELAISPKLLELLDQPKAGVAAVGLLECALYEQLANGDGRDGLYSNLGCCSMAVELSKGCLTRVNKIRVNSLVTFERGVR